ncbi:NAD(P)/FAD-dependent oxidoreductase [Nonomuraea rubra]|uniref:NAD(P)/FAD-dependent oxidoreductase n=1 Tax=Nonomuraea rubra TaxID=46180 RepID=UPI003614D90D
MATYVIVGAGLAGAKAAQTLREEGFDGEIVLIGAETERPYERPPLSKGYLQGGSEREEIFVHEPGWYAANDVDLRLGTRVTRIEPAHHAVRLGDGSRRPFDKLLIATGAVPRRLPGPAHYLRTVEDSEALKRRFAEGGDVLIIGASWIGLETAAAARTAGCQVTVVEPEPTALNRALGQELGELFARLHASKGVDLRFGTAAAEITETGARLSSGERLTADVVVVGIGAAPEVGLARDAGLDVGQGILTDASLRTSHPDVYAAGDVAEFLHPCTAAASASSTGPTPCTAARSPPGRCSARRSCTTCCRTSTPTSTSSAWSSPATSRATTRSSTGATRRAWSSSSTGCATAA